MDPIRIKGARRNLFTNLAPRLGFGADIRSQRYITLGFAGEYRTVEGLAKEAQVCRRITEIR